jgi:hypothetical protein
MVNGHRVKLGFPRPVQPVSQLMPMKTEQTADINEPLRNHRRRRPQGERTRVETEGTKFITEVSMIKPGIDPDGIAQKTEAIFRNVISSDGYPHASWSPRSAWLNLRSTAPTRHRQLAIGAPREFFHDRGRQNSLALVELGDVIAGLAQLGRQC